MRRVTTLFGWIALLVLVAGPASAQTRFAVEAGPLIPYGDFGDAVDGSAWIGARAEFQGVNALGQVGRLAFVVQTGYSDLETAGDGDTDASLFALGAGVRVHSAVLPFFLHGGIEYITTDVQIAVEGVGTVDASSDSFGPTIGAGLNFPLGAVFVEVEGRLHIGLGAGDDEIDPRFATITAAIGLPF